MLIKTIKVGSLQTNCYVLADELTKEAIIIDPGDEISRILPEIKGLKVRSIILTHGHPDHFGALEALKKTTNADLLMHPDDQWFFQPDQPLKDGDAIRAGALELKVIHTPGHSGGSICLYDPPHLFSGDTLFFNDCGRTDLPGGSEEKMLASLKKLSNLPDKTIVHPGHGQDTTIKQEKENGTLG